MAKQRFHLRLENNQYVVLAVPFLLFFYQYRVQFSQYHHHVHVKIDSGTQYHHHVHVKIDSGTQYHHHVHVKIDSGALVCNWCSDLSLNSRCQPC